MGVVTKRPRKTRSRDIPKGDPLRIVRTVQEESLIREIRYLSSRLTSLLKWRQFCFEPDSLMSLEIDRSSMSRLTVSEEAIFDRWDTFCFRIETKLSVKALSYGSLVLT